MTKAIEILTRFDIRPSVQRIAVMDYMLKHRTHATADVIFESLVVTMPTLSRTTVYNTLRLLSEKGALRVLIIESEAVHFDAYLHPHAHFLCDVCREIQDVEIPEDLLSDLMKISPDGTREVELNYRGTCSECIKKN